MLAIYNWGTIDSMNRMFGGGDRPSFIQSAGPMSSDYDANSKGLEPSVWNLDADGVKIYEAQFEVNRQARTAGPDDVMLMDGREHDKARQRLLKQLRQQASVNCTSLSL